MWENGIVCKMQCGKSSYILLKSRKWDKCNKMLFCIITLRKNIKMEKMCSKYLLLCIVKLPVNFQIMIMKICSLISKKLFFLFFVMSHFVRFGLNVSLYTLIYKDYLLIDSWPKVRFQFHKQGPLVQSCIPFRHPDNDNDIGEKIQNAGFAFKRVSWNHIGLVRDP